MGLVEHCVKVDEQSGTWLFEDLARDGEVCALSSQSCWASGEVVGTVLGVRQKVD